MHKYFRLEVTGQEHLPRRGGALITPNHSGFSGLDAMLISHEIRKAIGRTPRVLTHQFWFLTKLTAKSANKLGFVKASTANGVKALKQKQLVVLFPEGESGNFKPSTQAYRLQEFKRGFVRLALLTQSPIIPTLVIGAEESNINLHQLKLKEKFGGLVLPLPLNLLPLPARWKIVFLKPIRLPFKPAAADDQDLVHELVADLREEMQQALTSELNKRGAVFF